MDKHVVGESIEDPEGVVLVDEIGKEKPEDWSKDKTRNETDIIRTRVRKAIEQELSDDPYAQKVFSELLREAISQAEKMFEHPFKQYALFKEFEDHLNNRAVSGIPDELDGSETAKAYYGTFRLVLGEDHFKAIPPDEEKKLIEEAKAIDSIVGTAVVEHSLSPQAMESTIHKGILPRLFKLIGLEKAKDRTRYSDYQSASGPWKQIRQSCKHSPMAMNAFAIKYATCRGGRRKSPSMCIPTVPFRSMRRRTPTSFK